MEEQAVNTKNKWRYVPNVLTIIRMVFAVVVAVLLMINPYKSHRIATINFKLVDNGSIQIFLFFILAGSFFVVAALTDLLDGFIARKKHVISDFGKLWDPIADKVLVNSTLIILTYWQTIYVWVTVPMIVRDLVVDATRMFKASKGQVVPANIWGKCKTVVQMVGLILILFVFNGVYKGNTPIDPYWLSNLFLFVALFFSILSGVIYEYQMLGKPRKNKQEKKPKQESKDKQ